MLDDNVIEQHGNEYYLYNGPEESPQWVPFFPPGLAPGTYQVRIVLTDPSLHGPTYSKGLDRFDYPPQLPPDLIQP